MNEPTVNIPLLRKAVEWAEAEAAKPIELCEWNQLDWIATPKAQAEAREMVATASFSLSENTHALALRAPECGTCYCIAGYVTHEIEGVPSNVRGGWAPTAALALGIGESQADELFRATNTIEDVRRIAESIAGERL